jgi:phosphoribosylaminoimidazolecarboxamide formyltransferase/IMP cyclohydrolase
MFKYKNVLISVYDKTDLDVFANFLLKKKFNIYSTGGTSNYLKQLGLPVKEISNYTEQKEILGGRVKTLHPKIFGGLLADNSSSHQKELKNNQMINFDLLVVNLYPFEETLKKTKDNKEIKEMIDIGGHSLIRASVKNYQKTITIIDPSDYLTFIKSYKTITSKNKKFAIKALEHANKYDQNILNWFKKSNSEELESFDLRYGENPHQSAHAKIRKDSFEQIGGIKKLSYNNLLDLDAAINIIYQAPKTNRNTVTIVKHNTPCGAAIHKSQKKAFELALSGDPISAFGGIVVFNKKIEEDAAEVIIKGFYEVIASTSFSTKALTILSKKKNLRLLKINKKLPKFETKSIFAGTLHQKMDLQPIRLKKINGSNLSKNLDIKFFIHVLKFVKSNAIAIFDKEKLLSQCGGQTSRIDALHNTINKLKELHEVNLKKPLYLISDAFFPFEDSLKYIRSVKLNIKIFVPMGSINDNKIITYARKNKMTLYEVNHRHFKH